MPQQKESSISFDIHRITLGNLISIVTGIIAIFLAYSSLKNELSIMKNDIAWIKDQMQDTHSTYNIARSDKFP